MDHGMGWGNLPCRNPLSIQVCFNFFHSYWRRWITISRRNPLSIQVCFNSIRIEAIGTTGKVVIPYQFRSVSILGDLHFGARGDSCRNPLSIQVCFNEARKWKRQEYLNLGRNPLSIQVCFNYAEKTCPSCGHVCRNPLSIQVCFNRPNNLANTGIWYHVVIPYQFRSVSMKPWSIQKRFKNGVVIPYQFRSVSIQE